MLLRVRLNSKGLWVTRDSRGLVSPEGSEGSLKGMWKGILGGLHLLHNAVKEHPRPPPAQGEAWGSVILQAGDTRALLLRRPYMRFPVSHPTMERLYI